MAKKIKPSLKDYLRTGKRSAPGPEAAAEQAFQVQSGAFLSLLAPSDLQMWEPMLAAGITVELCRLDQNAVREDFQSMDGSRFTCYALAEKGGPLRPVRSDSQLNAPALLLKWDETGVLTVYDPDLQL